MAKNLFSVPIFLIVFRETLEASIIVSVLLGLVQQIVQDDPEKTPVPSSDDVGDKDGSRTPPNPEDDQVYSRRLRRKLRIQVFLGAALGLLTAIAIGASFITVWFTKASNLWEKSEELWEGIFRLIASLMIFIIGITMLKMDRAKAKWRVKLERSFAGQNTDRGGKTGRWVLFLLPFITVTREGLEAVVFVGGVALGQPAASIPIATIVGLICGLVSGFLVYQFASRTTLTIFLVVMTNLLLLIGSGLFSLAVWALEKHAFNKLLGADLDDAGGYGPGTYRVQGSVWYIPCCGPENRLDKSGWTVFSAIFGWTNSATLGSVLSYVFYWLAVIVVLIYLKFKEGRTTLFGHESVSRIRRRNARLESLKQRSEN